MTENYPSAGEVVRNISDLKVPLETLKSVGKFRVMRIDPPYFGGYEFWVVNERGFLWEPASTVAEALAYLESDEAKEYEITDRD